MKCTLDWKCNKISHRLKIETIKKRTSYTTMPIYLDDVNDGKFLAKITEGFDDGLVYETSEVYLLSVQPVYRLIAFTSCVVSVHLCLK